MKFKSDINLIYINPFIRSLIHSLIFVCSFVVFFLFEWLMNAVLKLQIFSCFKYFPGVTINIFYINWFRLLSVRHRICSSVIDLISHMNQYLRSPNCDSALLVNEFKRSCSFFRRIPRATQLINNWNPLPVDWYSWKLGFLRVCSQVLWKSCPFFSGFWIWTPVMKTATVLVYERGERGEGCPLLSSPSSVWTQWLWTWTSSSPALHNMCNPSEGLYVGYSL